jgi:predicted ArsR family transcriptional regulator
MDDASAPPTPGTLPTRQALVMALRRTGPATPDALADDLGLSRTAVLLQLRSLELEALVSRSVERHGVGRPRHRYDLTDAAQVLFPAGYAALARDLLEALRAVGDDELVDAVFAARRARQAEVIRRRFHDRGLDRAPLLERVRELAVIQDEQGYLCECRGGAASGAIVADADGAIRLCERNCAILDVAREIPAACRSELALFAEVLGTEVIRESHILDGDRACTYRLGGAVRS